MVVTHTHRDNPHRHVSARLVSVVGSHGIIRRYEYTPIPDTDDEGLLTLDESRFLRTFDPEGGDDDKPCPSCKGLGYLPATYSRGAIPCGCDEPEERDNVTP